MYFKKLEIFGFKSFADRTVLNFEPGITAIVGPNGCGKSNIFDAIRWVLGEQSVKELRGSSMEDVIFNGTEKKPSLGFAEVNLTFSNESKALPIENEQVTVTRRLYRSGESEYMMNKNVARLKDIQELFMGTGVGAEAYSLVQQGKVDLVVSAKPEDRRAILDEASGITKYKVKKKEAMSKLKDTENNLLRVNDIVVEVKRQIGSIERQANKARRYKEEFENLKMMEIQLARRQVNSFSDEKNKILSETNVLKEKEAKCVQEIEEHQRQLTAEAAAIAEIEKRINDIHAQAIKFDSQIEGDNRQIGFNEERIQNIDQSEQGFVEQKLQLIDRCRGQQTKIEELRKTLIEVQKAIQENSELLQEKKDSLAVTSRQIKEAKEKIKDNEEKILTLSSRQITLRNELTEIVKELQGFLARKRRLDVENEKVSCEKQDIDNRLQQTDQDIQSVLGAMNCIKEEKDKKSQVLSGFQNSLSSLEHSLNELENKKLFLESQKEFIEKLQTQYQDIPDPVVEGRFLSPSAPLDHHTGIIGKVKEVKAIEQGKFPALMNIFSVSSSQKLYEIICETKFIELDPIQIDSKIKEMVKKIEDVSYEKQSLQKKIKEEEDGIQKLGGQMHHQEKELSIFEAQKKGILEEQKKLIEELQLVDVELIEVRQQLSLFKSKEEELNFQLETTTQDLTWCQNDIKDKIDFITAKSQEKEEINVVIAQCETEVQAQQDKVKSLEDNIKIFNETLDGWLEEIKKIDDQVAQQRNKKEQYLKEMEEFKTKIEETKRNKESLNSTLSEHDVQRTDTSQRLSMTRQEITSLEEEVMNVKQLLHQQELREQQLSFNQQGIKDRLLQTYKVDMDNLPVEDTQTPPSPEKILELSLEGLTETIEQLRKKCDSYGAVNLVAIEEYDELKNRFEFLTKQQSDLLEAKSQLMNTITKINRTTRQMFMDTFVKVSEEFRVYFRMLFGGGEAQLVLLDQENVLESGIEIVARPPGKKLQNISLLSGGEKSLTAIALIFGVFKVNPSPFCVLDEIDAALDESNVGRFSYLLKDFAKVAQFIVITHNKKTIANSDVMYGITMQETGVSKIVSVKFSDSDKKKETEAVAAGV